MQLFYNKELSNTSQEVYFDKDESRHIVKVLRHKEGDILHTTNGLGLFFEVELISVSQKNCLGRILKYTSEDPLSYQLHMAVAPTKNNDRFEWFLEKATELGISEITPILCDNSERKVVKLDRFEKIVESAMKQCLTAYHPKIHEMSGFDKFLIESTSFQGRKLIAHCYDGQKPLLKELVKPSENCLVLIGPEGDFSKEEVLKAKLSGFEEISLGSRRLRTETAAIFVCGILSNINS